MSVALIFPWRPTDDRLEAWELTKSVVSGLYPFDLVATVDSGHDKFNRSASRNVGAVLAESVGAEVVVICDADSIPYRDPLVAAINGASDGLIHFPFDEAWYVQRKAIFRIRNGYSQPHQLRDRIIAACSSEGGVWVCKPETWFKAGGQDPRLAGWGCDDRAFIAASRTLVGMPVKHPGKLICLPHYTQVDRGDAWLKEDVELLVRYQDAYMNPDKMKEIIDERTYVSSSEPGAASECSPTIRILSQYLYR